MRSQSATSWTEERVSIIMQESKARTIAFNQFRSLVTNTPAPSVTMHKKYNGNKIDMSQWIPYELSMAIVEATKTQKQWNAEGVCRIGNVSINEFAESLKAPPQEDEKWLQEAMGETAWDDVSGELLDAGKAKAAKRAEMCY